MKIALLGDIHANLPALEAALDHARQRGVEAFWNIGDFVGYGPFPDAVVKRLIEEGATSIAGNYDLKVLKFERKRKKWRKSKRPEKLLAFQWAHDNLSPESVEYLHSLPQERHLDVGGLRILLTHGSPDSNEEHLEPHTPDERLRELTAMAQADVVICGHSHQPFARAVDGAWMEGVPDRVWFINTGSVGRPDDGNPRACYAILEITSGPEGPSIQVRHYRLEYDVAKAVDAIRAHRLPEAFAQILIQGYDLNTVLEAPWLWQAPVPVHPAGDGRDNRARLRAVLRLARSCNYEQEHTHQVERLSLRLFDELRPLHWLGAEERFWLRCGALLHDIGWIDGQKGHHKTSLRLIRDGVLPPFDERERDIIANIARYHRKAHPKDKHDHFAALSPVDQYAVTILAAILRVADGLDRTHWNVVRDLSCEFTPRRVVVRCAAQGNAELERERALEKGQLLEHVLGRELAVEWRRVR